MSPFFYFIFTLTSERYNHCLTFPKKQKPFLFYHLKDHFPPICCRFIESGFHFFYWKT